MNNKISITKKYNFEAAHKLPNHKGQCSRLHGHSYLFEVTISGPIIKEGGSEGMVLDFADLSKVVEREIINKWDHRYLNEIVSFVTTAENLALEIFSRLEKAGLNIESVRLWETAKAYAEVKK